MCACVDETKQNKKEKKKGMSSCDVEWCFKGEEREKGERESKRCNFPNP